MSQPRIALITGSTSGIGLGIAKALARDDFQIILHGLGTLDQIEGAKQDIESLSAYPVHFLGTDLTDVDAIERAFTETLEVLGPISVLVNNAGMQHTAPIHEFPVEQYQRIIDLNLNACFHTTRLLLPGMLAQNYGRIVNIASVHGLVASVNKAAYVIAKHGLIGLTKATALETAKTGITCNAICPGWTHTPLIQAQIDARADALGVDVTEGGRQLLAEKQPSQAFVTTDQLGELARFLCTDAAAQMTGASLPIDGGWTAQ
jgi:3-hydroxybutyrate dehydrogenase